MSCKSTIGKVAGGKNPETNLVFCQTGRGSLSPVLKIDFGPPTPNQCTIWSSQKRVNRDKSSQRQKVRKSVKFPVVHSNKQLFLLRVFYFLVKAQYTHLDLYQCILLTCSASLQCTAVHWNMTGTFGELLTFESITFDTT